jgi:hypothetical protein
VESGVRYGLGRDGGGLRSRVGREVFGREVERIAMRL